MPQLTPTQKAALAARLTELGLDSATPEHAADVLNTPAVIAPSTRTVPIPVQALQSYAFQIVFYARLNAAILSGNSTIAALAQTAKDLFESRLATVDSTNSASWAAFNAMLQALQTSGLLATNEISTILAMAVETVPGSFGPTPFQAIAGLGDVPIALADGHVSTGTCDPSFILEVRS